MDVLAIGPEPERPYGRRSRSASVSCFRRDRCCASRLVRSSTNSRRLRGNRSSARPTLCRNNRTAWGSGSMDRRWTRRTGGSMITEGVALGAVQVPAGGQPIVLFVEQQTTGGYPKIANVITADLPVLGRLRPRDEVRFELVDIAEARRLLRLQEDIINSRRAGFDAVVSRRHRDPVAHVVRGPTRLDARRHGCHAVRIRAHHHPERVRHQLGGRGDCWPARRCSRPPSVASWPATSRTGWVARGC